MVGHNSYSQDQSGLHSNSYFQETKPNADWSLKTSSQMRQVAFFVTNGNTIFFFWY